MTVADNEWFPAYATETMPDAQIDGVYGTRTAADITGAVNSIPVVDSSPFAVGDIVQFAGFEELFAVTAVPDPVTLTVNPAVPSNIAGPALVPQVYSVALGKATSGGNVGSKVTFSTLTGETQAGPSISITYPAGDRLCIRRPLDIPKGATAWNWYATAPGGSTYHAVYQAPLSRGMMWLDTDPTGSGATPPSSGTAPVTIFSGHALLKLDGQARTFTDAGTLL